MDRLATEANRRRLIGRLVGLRKSNSLTQADVADVMSVGQSVIAEIESGRTDVRISTVERYASAVSNGRFKLELVGDPRPDGPSGGVAETLAAYGPVIDAAEFWSPPALEELVRAQGTHPITDPAVLALAGVTEGEWDDFFAAIGIAG